MPNLLILDDKLYFANFSDVINFCLCSRWQIIVTYTSDPKLYRCKQHLKINKLCLSKYNFNCTYSKYSQSKRSLKHLEKLVIVRNTTQNLVRHLKKKYSPISTSRTSMSGTSICHHCAFVSFRKRVCRVVHGDSIPTCPT